MKQKQPPQRVCIDDIPTSLDEALLCMECLLIESMVLVAKIPSLIKKSSFYPHPFFSHFWR